MAVDIGVNIGNYSAELLRHNLGIEIHCFEPSRVNIEVLQTRLLDQQNISIIPSAVSSQKGKAILHVNVAGSGLGSLTKRRLEHFGIPFDYTEEVATIVFSVVWHDVLQSRQIDLVKLDIEGHELSALEGFGEAMQNISVIQFAFGGCNIDTRTYFQDFWYFFKEHGFTHYRINPLGLQRRRTYQEGDVYFSTTNYLAHQTGGTK